MASPAVDAALQNARDIVDGRTPSLRNLILGDYGVDIDARPTQYVSRSEYGYGPGQLPAVQASGAHYSAPGSREGYEGYNLPPVMYQRNPFATAAYRTFVDPYGQMSVQPLVGFPSAYPHVLSGVPTNPLNIFGMLQQMPMPFMPPWMMGQMPQPPAAPQGSSNRRTVTSSGRPPATPPNPNQPAVPPSANPQWVHYGDARAKADAMPVSPENLAWMNNVAPVAEQPPVASPEAFDWRWERSMAWPTLPGQSEQAPLAQPIEEPGPGPVVPPMGPSALDQEEYIRRLRAAVARRMAEQLPVTEVPPAAPVLSEPLAPPAVADTGYKLGPLIRDVY